MFKLELIPASQAHATSTDSRSDSTVWYEIRVSDPNGAVSNIRKTYTDFEELHQKLMRTPGIVGVPLMPRKSFFRKTFIPNGPFMTERRQTLAQICNAISSLPVALPAVRDFVASNRDPPIISEDAFVTSDFEAVTKTQDSNDTDSTCDTIKLGEDEESDADALLKVDENGELESSLRKFEFSDASLEENMIGTPPTSPRRSQSMQWLDVDDEPGTYEVRFACSVTEEMTSKSREICELTKGNIVNVLEVVLLKDESQIRGRIEAPSGWVSLEDTSSGARWAEKQVEPQKEPIVKYLIDFEECQREMEACTCI